MEKNMFFARSLFLLLPLLCSCTFFGRSLFGNDPVTGGVNSAKSELVDINLPAGLQRYPEHGFIRAGQSGEKEGLETLRGHVDATSASGNFYNSLKQTGWQLLTWQKKGSRALYLFTKNNEYLIVSHRPQGNLTIFELWRGSKLEDTGELFMQDNPEISIAPEEFGPLNADEPEEPKGSVIETWGSVVEEREL